MKVNIEDYVDNVKEQLDEWLESYIEEFTIVPEDFPMYQEEDSWIELEKEWRNIK